MAYVPKTWRDRDSEFPNRRIITHADSTEEQVTVRRDEGTVTTEGDPFAAASMNNLESRIAAGITSSVTTDTYNALDTVNKSVIGAINEVAGEKNLAEQYDMAETYAVGDYVIYETVLYKCIVGTTGGFDTDCWERVLVTDEMGHGGGGASALDDLTDVSIIAPTVGQALVFNGTGWENDDVSGGSSSLSELNDVAISSPTDKQALVYDATTQKWINGDSSGFALDKVATGSVVSFNDGADNLPVVDLTAQITAVQSGSGDPSPSNVRPISGFTGVNVHVADGETPHVIDTTYSVTWQTEAGTVYGGSIDLTTGVLTVTHGLVTLDGTETGWSANTPNSGFIRILNDMKSGNAQTGYCDRFATISNNGSFGVRFGGNNQITYFNHITDNVSGITTLDDWKTWLGNNPTTLVYPLATPQTYQLTPTEVKTLLGVNNIFADTGDISVDYQTEQASDIIDLVGEGGASDLADLGDVDLTTPTDGQVLTYDATAEKWVNEDAQGSPVVSEKTVFGSEPSATASTLTVTDAQEGACVKLTQKLIAAQINKPHYVPSSQPPVEEWGLIQKVSNATVTHEHDGTTDTISVTFSTSVYGCEYDFVSGVRKITHDAMTITTCTMNNTLTSVFAKAIDSKYIQRADAFIEASVYNLVPSRFYLQELKDHEIMLWYGNWNGTTRLWAVWRDDRFTANSDMTTWLTSDANHAICLVGELQTPTYSTETANAITLASGTNTFTSAFSLYFYEKLALTYVSSGVQVIIDAVQEETGISDLNDTQILNPSNNQALLYDSTAQKWQNKAVPVPWVEVTGNLAVGSTSITLSDAAITSSSTIDVYTDPELPHTAISVTTGSVTITFEAQQTIVAVKVRVS